ncbi:MAG: DUF3179 domain-containing (seleno)protein [Pseudomonadota bacterium]
MDIVFVQSLATSAWGPTEQEALAKVAASGDTRLAWTLLDMMRFTWRISFDNALAGASSTLTGIDYQTPRRWAELTDHLIAWDIPAYPGYLDTKRAIFTQFLPEMAPLFAPGDVDWRLISWGGVNIDDRPFGTQTICACIPAADDPPTTSAEEASWLADDATIFGIEIGGEARAYPRRVMEVREMVNDTLGGRDFAMPYCTLCGAAQAYFTDGLPPGVRRPTMRTSGLLSRSNKVMYDLETFSVFDTFKGRALTGPLHAKGVTLEPLTVITTTWADWKAQYPDTTVLSEELALGRDYNFRETRDAGGPIFPVGDVDPRLGVHEDIIGAITSAGTPIAFPRADALLALKAGQEVRFEDVVITLEAGGLRATRASGEDAGAHNAFWFAWSQFHPGTSLWQPTP